MRGAKTLGLIVAISVTGGPLLAETRNAKILTPASAWQVNYADDSCRLARVFSDGPEKYALILDQFSPEPVFNLVVAGKAFSRVEGHKVDLQFGPIGAIQTTGQLLDADFGSFGPAIMTSGISLVEDQSLSEREKKDLRRDYDPDKRASARVLTADEEAAITWFEVSRNQKPLARFELGPMNKPMAAMRTCIDELLTHWGLDAAAQKTLTRPVQPKSYPGNWVSSTDYPPNLLARGVQGVIHFRLDVDETGAVTGCHIQQSTRPAEFDAAVCKIMKNRAKLEPALDAKGVPVKSFWQAGFRFQMP